MDCHVNKTIFVVTCSYPTRCFFILVFKCLNIRNLQERFNHLYEYFSHYDATVEPLPHYLKKARKEEKKTPHTKKYQLKKREGK